MWLVHILEYCSVIKRNEVLIHASPWMNFKIIMLREKSRNITLLTKVCIVKAMVFPVVTYGCESWTTKKAEHWRIDAFELWCWRRLLRVPWTARRSNQSIPKGNQSWIFIGRTDNGRWSSNILATWCEEVTYEKRPWCWQRLKAGGERDDRGRDGWMASLTQWTLSLSKLWEMVKDREAWRAAVQGVTKSQTWLRDWSELNWTEDHWEGSFLVEGGLSSSGAERICLFEHRATCLQVITSQLLLPVWGNSTIFFLGFLLVCSSCFSSFLHM